MKKNITINDNIMSQLKSIKEYIICSDFEKAHDMLANFLVQDVENPQIYNLFGICYEKEGSREKAEKFYRISYYMDQTYSAPSHNLMRTCGFRYDGFIDVDWGLNYLGGNIK